MKAIRNQALLLAAGLTFGGLSLGAQVTLPYINDFTSEALPNMAGPWTLDTEAGVLNNLHPSGGTTVVSTATAQVTGATGSDLIVSTRFTVNDVQASTGTATSGFGAFGIASDFTGAYYLTDWFVAGANVGRIRILRQGGGSFSSSAIGDAGAPVVGETYELRLTGVYLEGTLNLTLAVFDEFGGQLGTAATATDAAPLSGEFFGLRNRTANASHLLDFDYDEFSVAVVPEPASTALMAGLAALGGLAFFRRRKR